MNSTPTPPSDPAEARHDDVPEERPPSRLKAFARKYLAKVWSTGGGGYYGTGYLCTFVWLEINLLLSELGEADGVFDFIASQLLERIFKLAFESFANSIEAFLWPVILVTDYRLWGVVVLVVSWLVYDRFVHHRMVAYLGIDPEAENKAKKAEKKANRAAKKADKAARKAAKRAAKEGKGG